MPYLPRYPFRYAEHKAPFSGEACADFDLDILARGKGGFPLRVNLSTDVAFYDIYGYDACRLALLEKGVIYPSNMVVFWRYINNLFNLLRIDDNQYVDDIYVLTKELQKSPILTKQHTLFIAQNYKASFIELKHFLHAKPHLDLVQKSLLLALFYAFTPHLCVWLWGDVARVCGELYGYNIMSKIPTVIQVNGRKKGILYAEPHQKQSDIIKRGLSIAQISDKIVKNVIVKENKVVNFVI